MGQEFQIRTSTDIVTHEEIEILRSYGRPFDRLMTGKLQPETEAQRRFVSVCRGEATPETEYEKVWWKYLQRLEWEKDPENRATMGPPRQIADTSFGGSREAWKEMRSEMFGDMKRRSWEG